MQSLGRQILVPDEDHVKLHVRQCKRVRRLSGYWSLWGPWRRVEHAYIDVKLEDRDDMSTKRPLPWMPAEPTENVLEAESAAQHGKLGIRQSEYMITDCSTSPD